MRGRVGTDIGIKLLPVMWMFLCIQGTSTAYEVLQWCKHTVLCISLSQLVSCAFSTIPICPFLIQRIFHSLVPTLFLLVRNKLHVYYSFSANQEVNFLTYGGKYNL